MTLSLLAMLGAARSCSRVSVRFSGSGNCGFCEALFFDGCCFRAFAWIKQESHVHVRDFLAVEIQLQDGAQL